MTDDLNWIHEQANKVRAAKRAEPIRFPTPGA
jgi:hypothetical protein